MNEMTLAVILFAVGLILLIKGGDWFVDGATALAERFHVPEILIGATVVSIGTTLPEVMVSANSALSGHSEIAYGNAIGSVICNAALISAITLAVRPGTVDKKSLRIPLLFFFAAAGIYLYNAYGTGEFTRATGILLLCMFAAYILISSVQAGKSMNDEIEGESEADFGEDEDKSEEMKLSKILLLLVIGAAAIAFGADFLVDNGTIIAKGLGVPESVIALTFVALGTSLPELVTAITSLVKGHSSLSLGNIIGANLFNLVLVCGLSITLSPFAIPVSKTILGMNASLVVDLPVMMLVMLILSLPGLIKGKLYRFQGILLLAIYAAFVAFQFASGAL